MEKRNIGELEVSVLGLGTNNFGTDFFGAGCDQRTTTAIVDAALESGVTFFDTAEEYSVVCAYGEGQAEQFLGAALGSRREEVVIATKFQVHDVNKPEERGAERIERALEGSLRRLGTDYIDLYQQHTPDPDTPIEETLEALDNLVQAGKVREIGCSNFSGQMIEQALDVAGEKGTARFSSAQNRYSVLDAATQADGLDGRVGTVADAESLEEVLAKRPEGFVEACASRDISLIPFFPLASGLLTGKYRQGVAPAADTRLGDPAPVSQTLAQSELSDVNFAIVEALEAYAREHGHSILELALSWLTSQSVIATVIAGATRPEQVRSNVGAAGWALSAENFAEIAAIVGGASDRMGKGVGTS